MKLRALTDEDLEMILVWRNELLVRKNMYTSHLISPAEHRSWYARVKADATKRYFIFESGGVASGVVGFTDFDARSGRSSWAFYAAPGVPRGTGSKMEYLALEQAFSGFGLHKLFCEVLAFNHLVIKLHQSFGFKMEGILREHHLDDDGEHYHDVYQLGILDREWREQRPAIRKKLKLNEVDL